MKSKFLLILFPLLAFLIPIEYRYHNVFRHISKILKPDGLVLPDWFDQKILFHPSDWVALVLFLVVLVWKRASFQQAFFLKGPALIWAMLACAACSIMASPLAHYPIAYFRLWQLCTAVFVFSAAASLDREERAKAVSWVSSALVLAGTFQAVVAIAQYVHQESFGLRWFGEPSFHRFNPASPAIGVPGGFRWIFDRWLHVRSTTDTVVRVMGTMSHPNMLGGFLSMTSIMTLSWFKEEGGKTKRWLAASFFFLQLVALTLTYSRAAIFATGLGFSIWLWLHWRLGKKEVCKRAVFLFGLSALAIAFLFHEQLVYRGGLVNYNAYAKNADNVRLAYQKIAFDMIKGAPLLGVGYHEFTYRIPDFLPSGEDSSKHLGGVHNIYLMWAAETGLISLLFYLGLIGFVLRAIASNLDTEAMFPFASVFIGFLFIGFCDFYFILFQAGRLSFFLVAGLLAAHRLKQEGRAVQGFSQ